MPVYSWSCPQCGADYNAVLSLAEYDTRGAMMCHGTESAPHDPVATRRVYDGVAVVVPEGFHE